MLHYLVMPLLMMLCVTTVASENQESYTGDCGELILECVVKNVPQSLSYCDLCRLWATSKEMAATVLPYKAEGLNRAHNSLKEQIKKKRPNVEHIVMSPQFPVAGYTYENDKHYGDPYYIEYGRFNSHGKLETKKIGIKSLQLALYVQKPQYINGTFCFSYRYKTHFPNAIYIDILGNKCEHPFGPEITLSGQEKGALKNYLYSDSNTAWDIKGLSAESQYKLANLLVRYVSTKRMFLYVTLCCGKKSECFWGLGTLRYSVVTDSFWFKRVGISESGTSVVVRSTQSYIEKFMHAKFFVDSAEGENHSLLKKRVKEWADCIDYLKNQRMVIKRFGNSIIRYDHLSNAARVIVYKEFEDGCSSKLIHLQENPDITTLAYTDDKRLKYTLLCSAEDEVKGNATNFLGYFFPSMQHKKWIFSEVLF